MENNQNNKTTTYVALALVGVVLLGGGVWAVQSNNATKSASSSSAEAAMIKSEETAMMKKDSSSASTTSSITGEVMTKKGLNVPYDQALLANASTGKVVVFFDASWCPTCQATNRDLNSKIDKIPSNLTILHADFDTSTALRQKYGVTTQHTFVQVDQNGNQLGKATGLSNLDAIVAFAK